MASSTQPDINRKKLQALSQDKTLRIKASYICATERYAKENGALGDWSATYYLEPSRRYMGSGSGNTKDAAMENAAKQAHAKLSTWITNGTLDQARDPAFQGDL
ncbi:hypothetical protein M408DRAFT_30530 [Serendipita vermifera MAFF 305830]|uniref:DRBM domain-containing protein n=1 Tax=Serendipita vermifera MAFF 305830 TaxID=933852 RepID=A0A0C2WRP7_SERVB|nr:hypothetical protein M408DRAFT_30530 [Serendipita vermifera MAFF 305830]